MQKLRRVSIFGPPGAGKTVLAHELFAYYKKAGRICEVVNELAREWAYVDRPIQSMDQLYLFSTQIHREDTLLTRDKGEFIITDSPVLLNAFYGVLADSSLLNGYQIFWRNFEDRFPSVNFYCPPNDDYAYHAEGRFHSREESQMLGKDILEFITRHLGENLTILDAQDRNAQALKVLESRLL